MTGLPAGFRGIYGNGRRRAPACSFCSMPAVGWNQVARTHHCKKHFRCAHCGGVPAGIDRRNGELLCEICIAKLPRYDRGEKREVPA